MLVLSRKVEELVRIGDDITVAVVKVRNGRVHLGITAPSDRRISRGRLETKTNKPQEPSK